MSLKGFASALLVASCCAAHGVDTSTDVLVWYIDLDEPENTVIGDSVFDGIKFFAVDSDGSTGNGKGMPKTYASLEDLAAQENALNDADGLIDDQIRNSHRKAGWYYTDLSGYDNTYSFAVELWASSVVSGWMYWDAEDPVSWNDLATAGALKTLGEMQSAEYDLYPVETPSPYNFGPHVVPEPSGGMLMLLGCAALLLRRRKTNLA